MGLGNFIKDVSGVSLIEDVATDIGLIPDSAAQRDAINQATNAQVQSAQLAIGEQRAAREEARQTLSPFVAAGQAGLGSLAARSQLTPQAPGSLHGDVIGNMIGMGVDVSRFGNELQGQTLGQGFGQFSDPSLDMQLQSQVLDPSTLQGNFQDNPAFQAQQAAAFDAVNQSAASRGKLGSSGNREALAKQSLLLSNQFQQQDIQNQLQAQGQQFGQSREAIGVGEQFARNRLQDQLQVQGQRFGQLSSSIGQRANLQNVDVQNILASQGQRFGQLSTANQQDFANRMASHQQGVGQNQFIAGLGQASAAGQAANAQQSATNIGGLLTGIGNAQAAGGIAGANVQGGLGSLLQTGLQAYGAYQGLGA